VLIVSSFVEPRVGGVERFTRWLAESLCEAGCVVRTLAADLPGARADIVVPVRLVAESEWPLVWPTRAVRRILREEIRAVDAVAIQGFAHPLCLWAALAARRASVPARTVVHTNALPSYGSAPYRATAAAYDGSAARLTFRMAPPVAMSMSAAAFIGRRFGRRAATLPYPLAALPKAATPLPPAEGEPLRLLLAARLTPEKSPLALVAALDRVREPIQLDVYGSGPLEGDLRSLASTRSWLRLYGRRVWEEVVRAQARAHATVSASVQDNVQLALLESLAMGVPVVATGVGEAVRYLASPLDRLCVPARDPAALAAAVTYLRDEYARVRLLVNERARELRAAHDASRAAAGLHSALCGP
jgi:glycosyltransferase involved in cell wall biosynthesis